MATVDRSTRRTPSSLAAAAIGGLLALAVAGCGAAATPSPVAPAASTAPGAAPTAAASSGTAAPSAPAASGSAGSACNLVSASDILSLTGATSATVITDTVDVMGHAGCSWALKPGAGGVVVSTWTGAAATDFAAEWSSAIQAYTAVSGVGDEAHWDGTGELWVKVGGEYASFQVGLAFDETITINLAKLVVPKLGG
jgi:Protein of unknown function (DUF3558)